MKTATTSGGGGGEKQPPFMNAQWLDAYDAQRTDDLVKDAIHFATGQMRRVAVLRPVDDVDIDQLVHDVLDDTAIGRLTWDPERVSLKKHVYDAIHSRARHLYDRAIRYRTVRIDAASSVAREAAMTVQDDVEHRRRKSAVSAEVLLRLRQLAGGDAPVLELIDALARGYELRYDILKHSRLTPSEYAPARKRMRRLTELLPARLRRAAFGSE